MRRYPAKIAADEEHGGAFFFPTVLFSPTHDNKSGAINFFLDTGSSDVVIGENDLTRLGIDIGSLPRAPQDIAGWGGKTEAFLLEDSCIILVDDAGQSEAFDVGKIICGKNPRDKKKKKGRTRTRSISIPSVIGRDFLRQYGLIAHVDIKKEEIYVYQE